MALFKIFKGLSGNLAQVDKHEGYCYFTPDDGKFYIDIDDKTRIPLNAEVANKLWVSVVDPLTGEASEKEAQLETVLTSDEDKIPTSKATMTYLATIETNLATLDSQKMDKENPTGTGSFSLNRAFGSEIGDYSFAEGNETTASGAGSHAEGYGTQALGVDSHAEGMWSYANKNFAHAEGLNTTADGQASHSEGAATTATSEASHVQGRWNIKDTDQLLAHIVGNGGEGKYSNAHTLDWDGNAWYSGDVYVGSTSGTNKDEGSKKLATEEYSDNKIIIKNIEYPSDAAIYMAKIDEVESLDDYKITINLNSTEFIDKKEYIKAQFESSYENNIITIESQLLSKMLPLTITCIKI